MRLWSGVMSCGAAGALVGFAALSSAGRWCRVSVQAVTMFACNSRVHSRPALGSGLCFSFVPFSFLLRHPEDDVHRCGCDTADPPYAVSPCVFSHPVTYTQDVKGDYDGKCRLVHEQARLNGGWPVEPMV
ncbi:hypothetical protein AXG93_2062s1080 [Marchantia polymorpha subsp. ruderalis]|uniref:Uncharacterized protein n=1 Tax=Marchantia polymorpha subsp. ruderalis TaxID=1480154 RepID=A0A176VET5_MARPO|nr:hypothetical protein AXG93_2062s1080 [Marchantia polymorpha subsp. ruderalis]